MTNIIFQLIDGRNNKAEAKHFHLRGKERKVAR